MAVAHLVAAGLDAAPIAERVDRRAVATVVTLCERGVHAPLTSSVGRLFDAVASLARGHDRVSFEGQAAIQLEARAAAEPVDGVYSYQLEDRDPIVVDSRPLIRAVQEDVARGTSAARIARRFHATLVDVIVAVCERLRARRGVEQVVLSGGVFMNALLAAEAPERLAGRGFQVFRHRVLPPNDGGLSFGQLAVAAGRDALMATGRPEGAPR
jgi:hydrogenase maturation protein HypF